MKYVLVVFLAASSCVFAQDTVKTNVLYQSSGAGVVTAAAGRMFGATVKGAPYSATITNESVQTLADGNRIVQNNSGTTARDSEGRTRQDAALPMIGNLSAANAPHIVFIMDPVAQISYTLNLTDKTAQKLAMPSGAVGSNVGMMAVAKEKVFFAQSATADVSVTGGQMPAPPPPMVLQKTLIDDEAQAATEDLGTQNMEGLQVTGVRTTRTIPAGEIGNEKPIVTVTEVWTSPDLKTVVYSKRSDPRMGEQTFKLTNITRAEPDASLFTVPADFKLSDGPQNFIYKMHQ
ncbi:MAG TPA: hypothetical protein VGF61_20010 [Candidatus Acidoferrum sp.]|jgi:hypothetical protein